MLYHNPTQNIVEFTVGASRYSVPRGAECEIPDRLAYVVAARNLPLAQGPSESPSARVNPEPVAKTKPGPAPRGLAMREIKNEAAIREIFDVDADQHDDESSEEGPHEPSSQVIETIEQLEAAGVSIPGKQRRR